MESCHLVQEPKISFFLMAGTYQTSYASSLPIHLCIDYYCTFAFGTNRVAISRGYSTSIVQVFETLEKISRSVTWLVAPLSTYQLSVSRSMEKTSVFSLDIRIMFTFFEIKCVGFWLFGDFSSRIHFWQSLTW